MSTSLPLPFPVAEPRIRFLVGGVQKGGTSALAAYLSLHPEISLPIGKEAHVFDSPEFDDRWLPAEVDAWSADKWEPSHESRMVGDATPLTIAHPHMVSRVARYNPAMRWIVLLRDPVERAISHYHMIRAWGHEHRSLFGAVLAEPVRLWRGSGDWSMDSPARFHSYVARGRYARQLTVLLDQFPRRQVLLLRSIDLALQPAATATAALAFLGLQPFDDPPSFGRVFEGRYQAPPWWSPGRALLKFRLRGEKAALRRQFGIDLG